MTLQLSHPAFDTAVADVASATHLLADLRSRAAREVDAVVDRSWSGAAADAFAEGWSDWLRASQTVLSALETMGALLVDVHGSLSAQDQAAAGSSVRLLGRLG